MEDVPKPTGPPKALSGDAVGDIVEEDDENGADCQRANRQSGEKAEGDIDQPRAHRIASKIGAFRMEKFIANRRTEVQAVRAKDPA